MRTDTLIVLAGPAEPELAMLDELPDETTIAVGDSVEAFARTAPDASVILNWSGSGELLRKVFTMCPGVRWVHSRAAGLDGQLFPELVDSPIPLTNGRGVFSESLGEFALGAMLFFAKDLRRMLRNQAAGVWEPFDIVEIAGATLGVIGFGDIGRAVGRRARAVGMRVLAVKRNAPVDGGAELSAEAVWPPDRMLEMIPMCDYLVVATPLTAETAGLVGDREFAAMKPGAVLINLGRGPVVDEAALIRALSERRIRGAALDVYNQEPLPAGHPFYSLDNLLLSPHCADHTPGWLADAMRFFLAQYGRFRRGEPLLNVVDKRLGY